MKDKGSLSLSKTAQKLARRKQRTEKRKLTLGFALGERPLKGPKRGWKSYSTEKKNAIHQKAKLECAERQLREHYAILDTYIADASRNGIFELFLVEYGIAYPEIATNEKILKLYHDRTVTAIGDGCPSTRFYSSDQWRSLRDAILEKFGAVCMKCRSTEAIAVDHIKPRSKFPDLELCPDNLQVLCRRCNSKKSNRAIVDYRPRAASHYKAP